MKGKPTIDDVRNEPAGARLDCWVAEYDQGWENCRATTNADRNGQTHVVGSKDGRQKFVPKFSKEWSAAGGLLAGGFAVGRDGPDGEWMAWKVGDNPEVFVGSTGPHALAMAVTAAALERTHA